MRFNEFLAEGYRTSRKVAEMTLDNRNTLRDPYRWISFFMPSSFIQTLGKFSLNVILPLITLKISRKNDG